MIPGAAIYTQHRKAKHSTGAMLAGFPAAERPCESKRLDAAARLHILGGLQFGCLELMQQIYADRLPYVFWDRAYFGGGTKTDRLRITLNHYQKDWVEPGRGISRFEKFGGRLEAWRKGGTHILVVPPSDAIVRIGGSDTATGQDWLDWTLKRLAEGTPRPVWVSKKGDPTPLEERLRNCHCVVTLTSNVAVEAVCAGVPVFCAGWSAAAPMGGNELHVNQPDVIENPPKPEREAWAGSLAWGQFTLDEIRSGFAREVVLGGA